MARVLGPCLLHHLTLAGEAAGCTQRAWDCFAAVVSPVPAKRSCSRGDGRALPERATTGRCARSVTQGIGGSRHPASVALGMSVVAVGAGCLFELRIRSPEAGCWGQT